MARPKTPKKSSVPANSSPLSKTPTPPGDHAQDPLPADVSADASVSATEDAAASNPVTELSDQSILEQPSTVASTAEPGTGPDQVPSEESKPIEPSLQDLPAFVSVDQRASSLMV